MKGVSVIICCYNSEKRIGKTLRYLLEQRVPDKLPWEVILIDNNCTDDTVVVAQHIWNAAAIDISLRIVPETTPGLSFARSKGVTSSRFEYLIFCDDDNWLCDTYVQDVHDYFEQLPSNAGIIGGLGEAVFEDEQLNGKATPASATGAQAKSDGETIGFVYGAGMALKKEIFDEIELKNIQFLLTDRVGKTMSSGGDAEICMLSTILGYKIYYFSSLHFFHFMPKGRINDANTLAGVIGVANSKFYLNMYNVIIHAKQTKIVLSVYPFIEMLNGWKLFWKENRLQAYTQKQSRLIGKIRILNAFRLIIAYYTNVRYFFKLYFIRRTN